MSEIRNIEAFPDPTPKVPKVTESSIRERPRKWWQIGGEDISHVSIDAGYDTDFRSSSTSSVDASSHKPSKNKGIFVAPEAVEVYKPVEGFEGAHRFDPAAKWTDEEEQILVRKVRLGMHHAKSLLRRLLVLTRYG
ncbi:hypothetical protein E4U53_002382 [Claviceps sorghi]|nr:hypothetical protein E4U53_002382 [Claviceps sorghi]